MKISCTMRLFAENTSSSFKQLSRYEFITQKQSLADVLSNKCFSKFLNFLKETHVLESLFNKVVGLKAPTQVFFCEICESFKNIFFHRTPPVDASDYMSRFAKHKPFTTNKLLNIFL